MTIMIDVGGDCGLHALPLAHLVVGRQLASLSALEPERFAFKSLERNLELNPDLLWVLIPC